MKRVNLRVLRTLATSSVIALGLAATGLAQAPSAVQPHVPPLLQKPTTIPALSSDLSCSITGSYDQAGQKPFQDGGYLASGGVIGSEWLHIKVISRIN